MSSLTMDRLICQISSQSSPNVKYDIRLRKDRTKHCWLSCNCKSWTTGPYQRGKEVYERYCKHTDRAIIEKTSELMNLGYFKEADIAPLPPKLESPSESPKEFTPIKITRKLRK